MRRFPETAAKYQVAARMRASPGLTLRNMGYTYVFLAMTCAGRGGLGASIRWSVPYSTLEAQNDVG